MTGNVNCRKANRSRKASSRTGSAILAFIVLALTLPFQAEAKRYIVALKDKKAGFSAMSVPFFPTSVNVGNVLTSINMMIVDTDDASALERLRQDPRVEGIEEDYEIKAPPQISTWSKDAQVQASAAVGDMDVPWGILAVNAPDAWNKDSGAQARVMVLDSGVDMAHPALFGQIEKAQNFTGGSSTDVTDLIGHGTHVSGTVLASGRNGGLVGVAPKARLLMGKVCGERSCPNSAILAGVNWAVQEKVDVVNMSLGGPMISPVEREAYRRAEAAGVMIVAATGNDADGPKHDVGYPAAVPSVMAVGAIDSTLKRASFSNYGPELDIVAPGVEVVSSVPRGTGRQTELLVNGGSGNQKVKAAAMAGSPLVNASGSLVFAELGRTQDFAAVDVRGKIALISRGQIQFAEKAANAKAAGALAAVIFNNQPGEFRGQLTPNGSEGPLATLAIDQASGEALKAFLQQNRPVQSAVTVRATDYEPFMGTSMATPHVAGVAALVRSVNKSLSPEQVRQLLQRTARPLGAPLEYGSGLVNASAALSAALVP
jgi:serine protease